MRHSELPRSSYAQHGSRSFPRPWLDSAPFALPRLFPPFVVLRVLSRCFACLCCVMPLRVVRSAFLCSHWRAFCALRFVGCSSSLRCLCARLGFPLLRSCVRSCCACPRFVRPFAFAERCRCSIWRSSTAVFSRLEDPRTVRGTTRPGDLMLGCAAGAATPRDV